MLLLFFEENGEKHLIAAEVLSLHSDDDVSFAFTAVDGLKETNIISDC